MIGFAHLGLSLLAETDSESGFGAIGLVFLLSGFGFYAYVYLRYRNVSKRHRHETETEATQSNLVTVDEKIRTLTGLSNSTMSGANNTAVQGAGGLPLSMNQLKGLTGRFGSVLGQVQNRAAGPSASEHPTPPPSAPAPPPSAPPPPAPPPPAPPRPHQAPDGQSF